MDTVRQLILHNYLDFRCRPMSKICAISDAAPGRTFGMTETAKTTAPVGPCSRQGRLAKLDGRTREARRLRAITGELTEHAGGADRVSVAQRYLIQRTAIDLLRLELLDGEMAAGTVSNHDARVAHALRNTVRLALRDLGLQAAAARPPTPSEALARIHGRTGAAA
jgi:hypothetical protein